MNKTDMLNYSCNRPHENNDTQRHSKKAEFDEYKNH